MMDAKLYKSSDSKLSLKKVDEVRRAREIASYHRAHAQPMPIVFNVKDVGAKVNWPNKFR